MGAACAGANTGHGGSAGQAAGRHLPGRLGDYQAALGGTLAVVLDSVGPGHGVNGPVRHSSARAWQCSCEQLPDAPAALRRAEHIHACPSNCPHMPAARLMRAIIPGSAPAAGEGRHHHPVLQLEGPHLLSACECMTRVVSVRVSIANAAAPTIKSNQARPSFTSPTQPRTVLAHAACHYRGPASPPHLEGTEQRVVGRGRDGGGVHIVSATAARGGPSSVLKVKIGSWNPNTRELCTGKRALSAGRGARAARWRPPGLAAQLLGLLRSHGACVQAPAAAEQAAARRPVQERRAWHRLVERQPRRRRAAGQAAGKALQHQHGLLDYPCKSCVGFAKHTNARLRQRLTAGRLCGGLAAERSAAG